MDISQAIIARSDQLNADDLVGGPKTFTVAEVKPGNAEQPVSIVLREWPDSRPFKPSKTVLRLLAKGWGEETDDWPPNARFTLFNDGSVKWGGKEVGGIRVSHMSHLREPIKVALAESKGKKSLHRVDPLPDTAPSAPVASEQTVNAVDSLRKEWHTADADRRKEIEAEVARLSQQPTDGGEGR